MQVVLGPRIYLHAGLHAGLYENPPARIRYSVRDAHHVFVLHEGSQGIFEGPPVFEAVIFDTSATCVHSSFWPVLGSPGWLVDADDLTFHIFCSHHTLNPEFAAIQARRSTRTPAFATNMTARAMNFLTAYAHPSCLGICLFTEFERRNTIRSFGSLPFGQLVDRVVAKMVVLVPALTPVSLSQMKQKWSVRPLHVVFCGRGYEDKRGAWALRAFRVLLRSYPEAVRVTYIGEIPVEERERFADVLRQIDWTPSLPRPVIRELLSGAHVLFHTAEAETIGAVIVEAAAAGMAIVTCRGQGYEHIEEWFGSSGALLIQRRPKELEREERELCEALTTLVSTPDLARSMGYENHRTATDGALAVAKRDRVLAEIYGRYEPTTTPLSVDHFVRPTDTVKSMSSDELLTRRAAYRSRVGHTSRCIQPTYEI